MRRPPQRPVSSGTPTRVVFVVAALFLCVGEADLVFGPRSDSNLDPGPLVPDGVAMVGVGIVALLYFGAAWWSSCCASPRQMIVLLVGMLCAGPVGFLVALFDSLTFDLINKSGVGAVLVLVPLIVMPLTSIVGLAAALAEGAVVIVGSRDRPSRGRSPRPKDLRRGRRTRH